MNTYLTILSLVILVAFVVIVFHSISVLVYRGHSRHIRENSLNHAPIVQVGKEWEEVYEPGDHTPFDKECDYNPTELD